MKIRDMIPYALGKKTPDVVIKNGKILNVFSGRIEENNIAIYRKRIVGIGDYQEGKNIIDAQGMWILPGFIDAHLHIESSMLVPRQFARAILSRGTTTIIADPHEIANVLGTRGLDYMIRSTEGIPLDVYIAIPSAVPATKLETSGAYLGTDDMFELIDQYPQRIIALGEVMNFPAVLQSDRELLTKIEILRHQYKKIDGHAPGLSGKALNAYLCAFIRSDHECSTQEEALEKIERGMQVFIREGSAARNFDALIGAVNDLNHSSFSFCTDDRDPLDILSKGHIDDLVRRSIQYGLAPLQAIRMATINTARHFNLRSMGAIAPGYKADLLFVDDLNSLSIHRVMKNGRIVVHAGQLIDPIQGTFSDQITALGHFKVPTFKLEDLNIRDLGQKIRVIRVHEGNLLTQEVFVEPKVRDGYVVADPELDIAKVAVFDRHSGKGFSLGFVQGLGLKSGAVATSVGHDAHNLCVAAMNDDDLTMAAHHVAQMNGGIAVVKDKKLLASLALPIAGLMSPKDLFEVTARLQHIRKSLKDHLGSEREVLMTLSFIQLSVIPELRLTDQGLVNVLRQTFVSLYHDEN